MIFNDCYRLKKVRGYVPTCAKLAILVNTVNPLVLNVPFFLFCTPPYIDVSGKGDYKKVNILELLLICYRPLLMLMLM